MRDKLFSGHNFLEIRLKRERFVTESTETYHESPLSKLTSVLIYVTTGSKRRKKKGGA